MSASEARSVEAVAAVASANVTVAAVGMIVASEVRSTVAVAAMA